VGSRTRTPQERERISRGLRRYFALRRQREKVLPSDLIALQRGATLRPVAAACLSAALVEAEALVEALGGPEEVTPQRRLLIDDLARAGALLRASCARALETESDTDAASRVSALIGARARILGMLGLERVRRELDLDGYLARRSPAERANGSEAPAADRGDVALEPERVEESA